MATNKRLAGALLAIGLLWPTAAWATPAWVVSQSFGHTGTLNMTTASFTLSGANRYMYCAVATQNVTITATSVTMSNGATPLTFRRARDFNNAGTQAHVEYWDVVAPPTGATTVTATMSALTPAAIGCSLYAEVDQTAPIGAFIDNGASTALATVDVASTAGDLVVDAMGMRVGTVGVTEGVGQTNRVERQSAAGAGNVTLAMSERAGAASVTMAWSVDDATAKSWTTIGVSLRSVGSPPPVLLAPALLLRGVGDSR